MLEYPELLKRVVDDVAALGVAGERELAATLYLVGTSRLLPRPLAAIVQGPTSSGKSYIIEKVASMFPAEVVVLATQMTPQALFHMKPGALKHRWIVAGERSRKQNDDTAEATRALREMISSGQLTKLMPMKVSGEIQTVRIDQEGPIAYAESTTLGTIFDEDANRCVLLTTDERMVQTQRIFDTLAKGYGGASNAAGRASIIGRHHALQPMLERADVVIPYATLRASPPVALAGPCAAARASVRYRYTAQRGRPPPLSTAPNRSPPPIGPRSQPWLPRLGSHTQAAEHNQPARGRSSRNRT